ncbi:MAG: hypothetical protein QM755_14015 [Luteolibacter sp.]
MHDLSPPAVPSSQRRRFVITWVCAWAGFAALGIFLSGVILVLTSLVLLFLQCGWESRLRKRDLPEAGQKNWIWRVCLTLCVALAACHLLASRYGSFVPGMMRYTTTGQLELDWGTGGSKQNLNIHYQSTAVSTDGVFTTSVGPRPETLTFLQAGKKSTWVCDLKNGGTLVEKTRTHTFAWTPEGLSRMTEDLYGKQISPEDEAMVASWYDRIAVQQGFPMKTGATNSFRNFSFSGSSTKTEAYTPAASALIAIATACLFGLAIHFTAKATMGQEQEPMSGNT